MKQLRFYHRQDCHLCEVMLGQLHKLQRTHEFELEMVEVDRRASDLSVYRNRIPVLETLRGDCLSEHFLDEDALLSYLTSG